MKSQATTLYPFVPSGPDFASALEFFAALGFEKTWQEGGLAGLRFGGAYFVLQDIDAPEWQKNQQVTFEVRDLDDYWSELDTKDLARSFAGVRVRPPTDFPWGREIHVIDPGGVCWHVRQRRAEAMVFVTQLVYVNPGKESVFEEFEAVAIPLIGKYGGELLLRLRPTPEGVMARSIELPYEIHLVRFPSDEALASFTADPKRQGYLHLKHDSVRSSLVVRGSAS